MSREHAIKWIKAQCDYDKAFKYNVMLLDQYDFSEFLTDGRSLWNLRDAIEEKYDKEFWDKYKMYVFDNLDGDDICQYFTSRYNVWFKEYQDWVVRHDHGTYEKTRRRSEDNS